jgi:protein tyrosine/serine phosphatase
LDSFLRDHAFFRVAWWNVAEVIPGKLLRANHPTPFALRRLVRRFGIRTVINLRGEKPNGSTTLSLEASKRLGLEHIFLAFESRGAPHRDRILRFYDVYRSADRPILVHCKSGADRAGLAAGLAILFEGGTSADALDQLSWRFAHIRQSKTGILDAFFEHFAAAGEGRKPFIDWVRDDYDENALRRKFTSRGFANFINDKLLARE